MYIYIFKSFGENQTEILKFGFSSKVDSRLSSHLSSNPLAKILYIYYNKDAQKMESDFHRHNTAIFGDEWYDVNKLQDMINFMNVKGTKCLFDFNLEQFNFNQLKYIVKS